MGADDFITVFDLPCWHDPALILRTYDFAGHTTLSKRRYPQHRRSVLTYEGQKVHHQERALNLQRF